MKPLTMFGVVLALGAGFATAGDLASRVQTTVLTLPHPLEYSSVNSCTWGSCSVGPRLYHAARSDGTILVGWTDSSGDGHVSVVAAGSVGTTFNYAGTRFKGLVAHDDGTFAVLLWRSSTNVMWASKRRANGGEVWSRNLNQYGDPTTVFNNSLGDSRLTYGNGSYGAYYTVHCSAGWCAGHEGDQYKRISDSGVVSTVWTWGCSHSMAQLVGYHPGLGSLTAVCSSDCYPTKGLNADHNHLLFESDGNCGGGVALQLGQMAAGASAWKVVFNAVDAGCCPAQGIGLATFNASYTSTVVWLTNTTGAYERDPVLARLPDQGATERYLVGWMTTNDGDYHLGIVDGAGSFLEGPESVGAEGVVWGYRNDSFLSHPDGSVTWVEGGSSSTTLRLHRYRYEEVFADGFEGGDTAAWSTTVG